MATSCPMKVLLGLCALVWASQAAVLRRIIQSPSSLSLALSDLHNNIYTGSNKEDGDGHNGNADSSPEKSYVWSVLLYGCECCVISNDAKKKLEATEMCFLIELDKAQHFKARSIFRIDTKSSPSSSSSLTLTFDLSLTLPLTVVFKDQLKIDKMSPDPVPAPDPAPPPAPDPAPAPAPEPAPPPDPAPAPAPDPDPAQPGPDHSNKEDGDGNGNNRGPDLPSKDPPAQQQQEQQEQQQQQQQQQSPATEPPPPPPDTPEPIPPGEIVANKKSNATDHATDTGSSEEKTATKGRGGSGGGGGGGIDPMALGSPDVFANSFGAPDPFDPFSFSKKSGSPVTNYIDPFDPFIAANEPPPPPPPPPPPVRAFDNSINMYPVGGLVPPPPPPPPARPHGGLHPVPPPPPASHVLFGDSPIVPLSHNSLSKASGKIFNAPLMRKGPPSGPKMAPLKRPGSHRKVATAEKVPVEKMSQDEAKAMALDRQSDLMDQKQDRINNMKPLRERVKPKMMKPPPFALGPRMPPTPPAFAPGPRNLPKQLPFAPGPGKPPTPPAFAPGPRNLPKQLPLTPGPRNPPIPSAFAPAPPNPPTPQPTEKAPTIDVKGLAADQAADAMDRYADLTAMAKERSQAARGAAFRS